MFITICFCWTTWSSMIHWFDLLISFSQITLYSILLFDWFHIIINIITVVNVFFFSFFCLSSGQFVIIHFYFDSNKERSIVLRYTTSWCWVRKIWLVIQSFLDASVHNITWNVALSVNDLGLHFNKSFVKFRKFNTGVCMDQSVARFNPTEIQQKSTFLH